MLKLSIKHIIERHLKFKLFNLSTLTFVTINLLSVNTLHAQSHPIEKIEALKRFDRSSSLLLNNAPVNSTFSIKGVKIGDNILEQAIALTEQGGKLARIRGGARSSKIKFSFFQPYETSELEQRIELYFDRTNGFIDKINTTYFLKNAYLNIDSVRSQLFDLAVSKYGSPMSIQEVYAIAKQSSGEVKLSSFIEKLTQQNKLLPPQALAYFKGRNITRGAKFTHGGDNKNALMHSGFDRCYIWGLEQFNEILSFCFFDKTGANALTRGIELSLVNFTVSQAISEFTETKSRVGLLDF